MVLNFKMGQGRFFHTGYQEEVFHTEGDGALEQVAQEVVDAPSLEAFKARLDVALGSLFWWLATLHIAGGLELDDHCDPFQPRPSYDSMKYPNFFQNCFFLHTKYSFLRKFHYI